MERWHPKVITNLRHFLIFTYTVITIVYLFGKLVTFCLLTNDNLVEVLNQHLSLLVGNYVPTKVIHVHKDKLWFDDLCRQTFGLEQEGTGGLTHLEIVFQ